MRKIVSIYFVGMIILLLFSGEFAYGSFEPDEKDLRGLWKFRIGDRQEWSSPQYDDSDWDNIRVPARWENEGFSGYDGYAWYRTSVYLSENLENKSLMLELGYIDDTDEVFINGTKIGQTGSFPPHYSSAYNAHRKYQIPNDVIRYGEENLIAVRVYDSQVEGGITSGHVRIYSTGVLPPFDIDLAGAWFFNKGKIFDENHHAEILVPGSWENQGYNNYDGYAVYTKKIKMTEKLTSQRLVLLAGRIDDSDLVFINGQYVGQTGNYTGRHSFYTDREFRNYFIAPGTFKADEENIIEIRVYDSGGDGGILEGPIGIMTQDKFRAYWKLKRKN